jgi:uncharacterized membrane protein/protein-disulfide isomerase
MKHRTLILLFAALGLGASAYSSYVHYHLLTDRSFASPCDISATVSCSQAYLSSYGSLFGVPVALGGVLFFALVLAIAGLGGRRRPAAEVAPAYIFALSTLGLAVVLYLGYASFFVLKTACILCITTYVSVIAVFLLSGAATSFPMTTLPSRAARDAKSLITSPAALLFTVLFVVGGAALIAAFPGEPVRAAAPQGQAEFPPFTADQEKQLADWFDVQPKVVMPVSADGAKVLIVKFNDFQCPPCRQTHELYAPILAKWEATGNVKFVLKHFPLESECNAAVTSGIHVASCEAAAAWNMATEKHDGSADRLETWLFDNQGPPLLSPEQVREAARKVAGITDFDARYEKELVAVKNDAGMGALLGVQSTPTFFINGHRIAGGVDPRVFDALIALELKRAAS